MSNLNKLLINASTLKGTGVCQVALSFIHECLRYKDIEFFVFLSQTMSEKIDTTCFGNNFHFYHITHHPIYGLKGFKEKIRMKKIEKEIHPDCVFSVFGPSCWKPQSPHLMGYAYPHYVYPDSPLFNLMSIKEKFSRGVLKLLHKFFLKNDGKYYVCETEDVSNRLSHFLNVDAINIFTVSNGYNHYFKAFSRSNFKPLLPHKDNNEHRFLLLCSPYQHKNIAVLNQVIEKLVENNYPYSIRFIVTISNDDYYRIFTKKSRAFIYNVGVLHPSQCPQIYYESDYLLSPTLLECFSANYPEAMFMRKPILTSDLPFATTVCGDAALYFDPLNSSDIVSKIINVISNQELKEFLIKKGLDRLSVFSSAEERADKYIELCRFISERS